LRRAGKKAQRHPDPERTRDMSDRILTTHVGSLIRPPASSQVRVGGYSIEAANPRHEHEWKVWKSVKLPPGRKLLPGVISHATTIVEPPITAAAPPLVAAGR
jgi:methionine synthase II (cobalamin-independent)